MPHDDRRYRLLLRLLPRAFREEHERELLRLWRDESADALPDRRGRVWRAAVVDTLRTAPGIHAASWSSHLRHAWRGLTKSPVFAVAAIITLALGTGATGGVFSLLNTVVLQPLPWVAPDRVGLVWAVPPNGTRTWLSFPELEDLEREVSSLASVVGITDVRFALTSGESADEVQSLAVSHSLLSTLGVTVAAGRDFVRRSDVQVDLAERNRARVEVLDLDRAAGAGARLGIRVRDQVRAHRDRTRHVHDADYS